MGMQLLMDHSVMNLCEALYHCLSHWCERLKSSVGTNLKNDSFGSKDRLNFVFLWLLSIVKNMGGEPHTKAPIYNQKVCE